MVYICRIFELFQRVQCPKILALRASVYRALLDARSVAKWKVSTGMANQERTFDAREGDSFRISLTYGAMRQCSPIRQALNLRVS